MFLTYLPWLVLLSLLFTVFERLRPRYRTQRFFRPGIFTDVFYFFFNGHLLGVLLAKLTRPLAFWVDHQLQTLTGADIHLDLIHAWPAWAQFLTALLLIDLLHYGIHNLLHRVPALWAIHRVHHSIEHLDWLGSLRFHFGEIFLYKTLSYIPLMLLGASSHVLLALAVFNTLIGHFNHANLQVSIGPLKYLFNHPAMHIWHHVHPEAGPINRNFGITLSVWDWLFGTAHVPDHPPARLGFAHIEQFPKNPLTQAIAPITFKP